MEDELIELRLRSLRETTELHFQQAISSACYVCYSLLQIGQLKF